MTLFGRLRLKLHIGLDVDLGLQNKKINKRLKSEIESPVIIWAGPIIILTMPCLFCRYCGRRLFIIVVKPIEK